MENKYALSTPVDTAQDLAEKIKQLRLSQKWKQATLAERSGVTLASLRRFENSGKVSLSSILKLSFALGRSSDFDHILLPPKASSISELENNLHEKKPKRGSLWKS